jgi:hypothetical protein
MTYHNNYHNNYYNYYYYYYYYYHSPPSPGASMTGTQSICLVRYPVRMSMAGSNLQGGKVGQGRGG